MSRAAPLMLLTLSASPAAGFQIPPLGPAAKLTPDGRHVLLYTGSSRATVPADDLRPVLERDLPAGLYRRGEWGAPLWPFPRNVSAWSDALHLSDDAVHLVVVPFWSNRGPIVQLAPVGPRDYLEFRGRVAFHIFARGVPVRAVTVAEVTAEPERLLDDGYCWLNGLTLDEAAGVVRVRARDGNETAFALATGERVAGRGASWWSAPIDWSGWAQALGWMTLEAATVWVVLGRLLGRPARLWGKPSRHRAGDFGSAPAARVDGPTRPA